MGKRGPARKRTIEEIKAMDSCTISDAARVAPWAPATIRKFIYEGILTTDNGAVSTLPGIRNTYRVTKHGIKILNTPELLKRANSKRKVPRRAKSFQ